MARHNSRPGNDCFIGLPSSAPRSVALSLDTSVATAALAVAVASYLGAIGHGIEMCCLGAIGAVAQSKGSKTGNKSFRGLNFNLFRQKD
jgi:alkaline phosphatase